MTYGSVRSPAPLAAGWGTGEPSPTRQPCYLGKAFNLKDAWSPGESGTLSLAGVGCLSVSAGWFRLPAWLISDDPGREK
jgi:hypothetical protein